MLRALDVVVFPNQGAGLGRPVLEAAAYGVPVVASGSPHGGGVLEPGETGVLLPRGTSTALADALAELAADGELRAAPGRGRRARITSPQEPQRRSVEVYRRVLSASAVRCPPGWLSIRSASESSPASASFGRALPSGLPRADRAPVGAPALTLELARREVSAEHSAKRLGMFWGLFQPLALLAVYAFVYGVVFRVRIGGTYELPRNYTIYLLSGLVPWFAFQLSMTKATTVITGNANLVKQVVFDLFVLPVATALAACLSLVLGLAFIVVYTSSTIGTLPAIYLLLAASSSSSQFLAMAGVALCACPLWGRSCRTSATSCSSRRSC